MNQAYSPLRARLCALLPFFCASALLVAHALVFNFLNDDAFISFRYAQNLVKHGELVFNLGERVEGYTNFLWTLLMAGILKLGLSIEIWSRILGIACSIGSLWAIYDYARKSELDLRTTTAALVLLALMPSFACWSTGGLESSLFTCTVTFAGTHYLMGHGARSGLFFGLAALTRPEGLLFFGLAGLHRLLTLLFVERHRPTRNDWIWGCCFAALFLPYQIWRYRYYGWIFPNTYYIKTGASGFWKAGFRYFGFWLLEEAVCLLPILAFFVPRRIHGRLLTLSGLFFAGLSWHVIRVGGDFMALHRFLMPLLPFLALIAILGAQNILSRFSKAVARTAAIVCICGLCTLYACVDRQSLKVGSSHGVDSIGWLSMFHHQCTAIGRYLKANFDPKTRIATSAAGIIPYYSELYTLDQLGLNDAWIAHNVQPQGKRPGHTKHAPWDYIQKQRIDLMVGHPQITDGPVRQSGAISVKIEDLTSDNGKRPAYWTYRKLR